MVKLTYFSSFLSLWQIDNCDKSDKLQIDIFFCWIFGKANWQIARWQFFFWQFFFDNFFCFFLLDIWKSKLQLYKLQIDKLTYCKLTIFLTIFFSLNFFLLLFLLDIWKSKLQIDKSNCKLTNCQFFFIEIYILEIDNFQLWKNKMLDRKCKKKIPK